MKSMYFKNLARGLVIVSAALALANCGDAADKVNSAISEAQEQYPAEQGEGAGNLAQDPAADPAQQGTDPSQAQNPADPAADPNQGATDPAADPAQQGAGQGQQSENPGNPNQQGEVIVVDPIQHELDPDYGGVDVVDTNSSSSSDSVKPTSSESVSPASSSSEQKVSSSSEVKAEGGVFLAEGTDEDKDQMQVEYIEHTGDNGGGILAYPKQLSNDKKHAVVLWGPGGGTEPGAYSGIIRRLASHGFIVVATSESPDGTNRGKPMLDWLAKKNTTQGDPLYGKIDMTKVGCSGHSMGGLQSEQMLINDERVITAVMNNSGAFNHAELTKVSPNKTVAIVYGEGGMERPNAEGDYNNNNVKAPACLIKMTGGQGTECQNGECGWGHGSGPWGGMAATVAWMRWHLGGEDFRKKDFVGTSGKYIDGAIIGQPGKWKGQCKNF